MYGYHTDITNTNIDEFFNRINQEEVFKHLFGDFEIGTYITSPFRDDGSPGCWIQWSGKKLYFTDFASNCGRVNLDALGIIQKKYNLSVRKAMDFILSFDFTKEPEYPKFSPTSIVSSSNNSILEFCPKPFDEYHKLYWSQYEITSTQLILDNIFATKWYKVNNHTFNPYPVETTYTISYSTSIKICRPKATSHKWTTNATKDVIGGTRSLPFLGKNLIITKSYKDWRVLTNLGFHTMYFQNEGMFPTMENLYIYLEAFDNVYILFDNDAAGVNASSKLKTYINDSFTGKVESLLLPTKSKDPADAIKAGEKQKLISFLNPLLQ
jgi:hypothetical protein